MSEGQTRAAEQRFRLLRIAMAAGLAFVALAVLQFTDPDEEPFVYWFLTLLVVAAPFEILWLGYAYLRDRREPGAG